MVRKSTQRSNKRVQNTRRARKVGGAPGCAAALKSCLPDEDDYGRMVDYECSDIDTTKSYEEFLDFQTDKVSSLNDEDCAFLLSLCQRVKKNKIGQMDLESCAVFGSAYVFFDKKGKIIIANPR